MNKLDSTLLQMEQFSEDKMQNLSGGCVEGSLSDYSKREAAESVTVFVAEGQLCGCGCDKDSTIGEPPIS